MEKFRIFEEEGRISFSNRPELIQFVSDYLALQYKKELESWIEKSMDNEGLKKYWENEKKEKVTALKEAIEKLLNFVMFFCKTLSITNDSMFLKLAFKKAQIKQSPKILFPSNIEYRIQNLMFLKM